ncbi:MAG: stomatin-like protein [Desulforegulaceae bacterium]|nr:stomatin-like protein [Desulforegulaceae bacterium]
MTGYSLIIIGLVVFAVIVVVKTARVIPQKEAFVVERLGKYRATLHAGFHILIPFLDKVSYKHTLKEQAIDVPSQTCITKDNISVEVDGILYMQVLDANKASYGIDNYRFASIQLAQTTMRSVIGKMELDKTFEERDNINGTIVAAVDKASDPWGVKVTRYEVKNIVPPQSIKEAMERQMKAERDKRAAIAESEGDRQSRINRAEGMKKEAISVSEGEMQKRINEAEGHAQEILKVANAISQSLKVVGLAIKEEGGEAAVNLRIAEQYIGQFGNLAKESTSLVIPTDLSDITGFVKTMGSFVDKGKKA